MHSPLLMMHGRYQVSGSTWDGLSSLRNPSRHELQLMGIAGVYRRARIRATPLAPPIYALTPGFEAWYH
jgi:hypothetical protein